VVANVPAERVDTAIVVEPGGENFRWSAEKFRFGRVLVVDDEPLLCWSVGEILRDSGFRVTEAGDAASAMTAFRGEGQIDVVLLDLVLPDSDDLRLLSTMRRLSPGVPVILMTAHSTPELLTAAMDLGAFATITKPFEMDELPRLVRRAIEQRHSM
jgi:DNA-binding NtrC family response regulator